jgi:hypothetical protein
VTGDLPRWQAARNRAVAELHPHQVEQFGLRPIDTPATEHLQWLLGPLRDTTVWAWQPTYGAPGDAPDAPPVVRAGLVGRRLHLGHLSLARDVARLQGRGLATMLFAQTGEQDSTTDHLLQSITAFGGHDPDLVDVDSAAVRAFEDLALTGLPLRRLTQVYGWNPDTDLGQLRDVAMMTAFLLYGFDDRPSVALVDAGRPTAAQQRELGGEPTRCPAFEVIELLCPPGRAEETLRRLHLGQRAVRRPSGPWPVRFVDM